MLSDITSLEPWFVGVIVSLIVAITFAAETTYHRRKASSVDDENRACRLIEHAEEIAERLYNCRNEIAAVALEDQLMACAVEFVELHGYDPNEWYGVILERVILEGHSYESAKAKIAASKAMAGQA